MSGEGVRGSQGGRLEESRAKCGGRGRGGVKGDG